MMKNPKDFRKICDFPLLKRRQKCQKLYVESFWLSDYVYSLDYTRSQ